MTFGIGHLLFPFSIPGITVRPSPTLRGFLILQDSRNHEAAKRVRPGALTCPPKPLHRHKGNYAEGRTDCKPRANNAILRGWWGNPWGFKSPLRHPTPGGNALPGVPHKEQLEGHPTPGGNALPGVPRKEYPEGHHRNTQREFGFAPGSLFSDFRAEWLPCGFPVFPRLFPSSH